MAECRACKFFVESTGTCGTLILGKTVDAEKVSYYKKKIKLCGCVMKWKTKYRLSTCPAGKWGSEYLSEGDINELRKFVLPLAKSSALQNNELQELFKWYSKITGTKQNVSTCPPCVKSVLTDLLKEINRYDGVITAQE